MKKTKFNSFCVICKTPANAPAGFSNVNKVTLCRSKKCRRTRKTCLQRERRRQMVFKLEMRELIANTDGSRTHRKAKK